MTEPQASTEANHRLMMYKFMLIGLMSASIETQLQTVNQFFNFNIEYGQDVFIWGKKEYWACLEETLERGVGDCDDIAIAKYTALKHLGVDDLKLAYVTSAGEPHMVVICQGFYLDNIIDTISKIRPDLTIVYTFDDESLWAGDLVTSAPEHLSQWKDLLARTSSLTA